MNRFNPNKLLHSKWTAVQPENKERHFIVTGLSRDDDDAVISCALEAVMTKNSYTVTPAQLKPSDTWLMGWK